MADLAVSTSTIDGFFRRWEASGAAERANYSMFLNELCDLLDVPRPDPAGPDDEKNAYVFEHAVPFPNPDGSTTVKRIDLYKRDCFVLEAKQGSDRVEAAEPFSLTPHKRMHRGTDVRGTAGWGAAMYEAKGQAELHVRKLPASEHNPPFIIVADVGHSIELFSDFSRQGRTYIPFPDPRTQGRERATHFLAPRERGWPLSPPSAIVGNRHPRNILVIFFLHRPRHSGTMIP